MNSLHESVSQRRAAEPADLGCVSLQPDCPALVIRQWNGASWVLPWSQLAGARLTTSEGDDQIELSFTHCVVRVTGANLRGLVEDLAAFRIAGLRDLPANYRPPEQEIGPFISHIEVCEAERESHETPG